MGVKSPVKQMCDLYQFVDEINVKRGGQNGSKTRSVKACKANNIPVTTANRAQFDGIHSKATRKDYLGVWIDLARYAREQYHTVYVANELTSEIVSAYVDQKLSRTDNANTAAKIHAALEKLGVALSRAGYYIWDNDAIRDVIRYNKADFSSNLRNRAPERPYDIAKSNKLTPSEQTVVMLAIETGMRLDEAHCVKITDKLPTEIRDTYLLPDNRLVWAAKNGQVLGRDNRLRYCPDDLASEIRKLAVDGIMEVNKDTLNTHLHNAAEATGQTLDGGLHPFRYVFAQESYKTYLEAGLTPQNAALEVAEDMGHHRDYVTKIYLADTYKA
jgi:hypothetical protein